MWIYLFKNQTNIKERTSSIIHGTNWMNEPICKTFMM